MNVLLTAGYKCFHSHTLFSFQSVHFHVLTRTATRGGGVIRVLPMDASALQGLGSNPWPAICKATSLPPLGHAAFLRQQIERLRITDVITDLMSCLQDKPWWRGWVDETHSLSLCRCESSLWRCQLGWRARADGTSWPHSWTSTPEGCVTVKYQRAGTSNPFSPRTFSWLNPYKCQNYSFSSLSAFL